MKKRLLSFLCALMMLIGFASSALAAGVNSKFDVTVVSNYWYHYTAFGDNLYVPYLKLEVKNKQSSPASKIVVKVVFYDENKKEVFNEQTDYLVSYGDTALRSGYSKTSFIKASVGYAKQISVYSLPYLTAEIYINDEYCGIVEVMNTYDENTVSIIPGISIEAMKQEKAEKEAQKTPEERIAERCSDLCKNSTNGTLKRLGVSSKINVNTDVKYDEKSGKFACVAVSDYYISGLYTISFNGYGYIGHIEGTNVIIDNTKNLFYITEDKNAVNTFWSENWK